MYKYVEFPSGIVVFPDRVPHRMVTLFVTDDVPEVPRSAGNVMYHAHSEGGIGDFDFSGWSTSLQLGVDTLSKDWEDRYLGLECSPRKLTYFGPLFKTEMYLILLAPGEIVVMLTEEGKEVLPHRNDEVDMLELIAELK